MNRLLEGIAFAAELNGQLGRIANITVHQTSCLTSPSQRFVGSTNKFPLATNIVLQTYKHIGLSVKHSLSYVDMYVRTEARKVRAML